MTTSTSNLLCYRQLPRSTDRTRIALDLLNTAVRLRPDNHATAVVAAIHYCKLLDICPCTAGVISVVLFPPVLTVFNVLFIFPAFSKIENAAQIAHEY